MKSIWKFPIGLATTHEMPVDSKFLTLQVQNGEPVMWFEVDHTLPKMPRKFKIIGTGHKFEDGTYLGTFQNEPFVWHVYEDHS